MELLYDLKDVCIIPAAISDIASRSECNPYQKNGKLPVFNAPMSVLMGSDNDISKLYEAPINVVVPRSYSWEERKRLMLAYPEAFISIGLGEVRPISDFVKEQALQGKVIRPHILVDIANGHMRKLIEECAWFKKEHPDSLIMAGNIANPNTLIEYDHAGIDYVRCSVGSGFGCITTPSTGIFYPQASLIRKCRELKNKYQLKVQIIADGGIDTFSKLTKCLALGADYVMCGKMFAQCRDLNPSGLELEETGLAQREYYGMASKKGQQDFGLTQLKTEEGRVTHVEVKYELEGLMTLISDYIKSAMSYTNCRTLNEFTSGNVEIALCSNNASSIFDRV